MCEDLQAQIDELKKKVAKLDQAVGHRNGRIIVLDDILNRVISELTPQKLEEFKEFIKRLESDSYTKNLPTSTSFAAANGIKDELARLKNRFAP